jgi:hypothetical protein
MLVQPERSEALFALVEEQGIGDAVRVPGVVPFPEVPVNTGPGRERRGKRPPWTFHYPLKEQRQDLMHRRAFRRR